MIELMITVAITGVCLVMALRAFAISAAAVSKARSSILAAEILAEKINAVCEKCISENGLEPYSFSQQKTYGRRKISFSQDVTAWESPAGEDEETEGGQIEDEDIVVEEIDEEEASNPLTEVNLNVKWRSRGKSRGVTLRTLLPYAGFRNDF